MTPLDASALVAEAARHRWYGARDRRVAAARVIDEAAVATGLRWVLLEVTYEPSAPVRATAAPQQAVYQLVVDEANGADAVDRPEVLHWMFPDLRPAVVETLAGEQSNSSVVLDGTVIVKIFRRLLPPGEVNPDVEVVQALWDAGFRSLPEPVGQVRRGGRDLAVARRFLSGAVDGWELALGDTGFLATVAELGAVTATMHLALAEAFGAAAGDGPAWAAAMRANLARVALPDGLDAAARFAVLDGAADVGRAIRIHGDFHLGQVLWRQGAWFVLDFEGEPARPAAERRATSSPLRDVAGMLRSFAYAAAVAGHPPTWEAEARRRFWSGYWGVEGVERLLPAEPGALADLFELDKAVYEVGYERASRPDWEHIPLGAVRRLLS